MNKQYNQLVEQLDDIKEMVEDIYFADDVDDPEEVFLGLLIDILAVIYGMTPAEVSKMERPYDTN